MVEYLAFISPWALTGIIILPFFWWLFNITPPVPKSIIFPPVEFIRKIKKERLSNVESPWWLILLRLILLLMIILAAARPLWNNQLENKISGDLLIVIDDGWSAAPGWNKRHKAIVALIKRAELSKKQITLLTTAPAPGGDEIDLSPVTPKRALEKIAILKPKPWASDRQKVALTLEKASQRIFSGTEVIWFSDGLDTNNDTVLLAKALTKWGSLSVVLSENIGNIVILRPPEVSPEGLKVAVERPGDEGHMKFQLIGRDYAGFPLLTQEIQIGDGKKPKL